MLVNYQLLTNAAEGPIVRQRVQWMAAFVLVCHWLLPINRVTSEIVQRAVLGLPRKQRYIRTRPLPLPYGGGRYSEKMEKSPVCLIVIILYCVLHLIKPQIL